MKYLQSFSENLFIFFLVFSIIILPLSNRMSGVIYGQTQDDCVSLVKQAEVYYKDGLFEEAIELLTQCLNKDNVSNDIKMEAYKLLGLTYLAIDYRNAARTAINKLLDIVPNYKIDPNDPPQLVSLIEAEREKREIVKEDTLKEEVIFQDEQKKSEKEEEEGSNIFWYIGGGVLLVAGVLVILLIGGDENGPPPDDNLPAPPDLP